MGKGTCVWDEHHPTAQLRGLDAILSVTQPAENQNLIWQIIEIRQKWFLILPFISINHYTLGKYRYETFWYWILQRGMVSQWGTSLFLCWKNI